MYQDNMEYIAIGTTNILEELLDLWAVIIVGGGCYSEINFPNVVE